MARLKKYLWIAAVLALCAACTTVYVLNSNSIERRIIRAIDLRCASEGECEIDLSTIMDFQWDTVSVFVASGGGTQTQRALGIRSQRIDILDGIVFSYRGEVVKMHTSAYDYNNNTHPRQSYWIEREPWDLPYRSYPFDRAVFHAMKIARARGGYRYCLIG